MRKLYRSKSDRKLLGVLGGIATYFNLDATILRVLYVILSLGTVGTALVIYLIVALFIPEEPESTNHSPYQQANYEPYDNSQN